METKESRERRSKGVKTFLASLTKEELSLRARASHTDAANEKRRLASKKMWELRSPEERNRIVQLIHLDEKSQKEGHDKLRDFWRNLSAEEKIKELKKRFGKDARAKMRESRRKFFESMTPEQRVNYNKRIFTDAYKENHSKVLSGRINRMSEQEFSEWMHKTHSGYKHTFFFYRGTTLYLKSSYELEFATFLSQNKIDFLYEKLSVIYLNKGGKEKRYSVDFYLPLFNLAVEVKPLRRMKDENVVRKAQAVKNAGYRFEFVTEDALADLSYWKAKVLDNQDHANQQPSRVKSRKVQRLAELGTPSLMTANKRPRSDKTDHDIVHSLQKQGSR